MLWYFEIIKSYSFTCFCDLQYAVSVQRCSLVILDPKKIGEADALVARLQVPKHLNFPLGFHGFWATDQ